MSICGHNRDMSIAGASQRFAAKCVHFAKIPTFILGPLRIHGTSIDGAAKIAFSTTEAVLPQSIQRGVQVINHSGGCVVRILNHTMTRSPVFLGTSLDHAIKIRKTIEEGFQSFDQLVRNTTKHGKLHSLNCWIFGRLVYARFGFSTGDAMGMNMVTEATDKIARWIIQEVGCRLVSISSNVCADKKAAGVNFLLGRGAAVIAEVTIPRGILQQRLHVSVEAIQEVVSVKNHIGSAVALSPGYLNAHLANVLAGIFAATGQDIAQLVESSMGIVLAELSADDSLVFSVTLPCLEMGTVGGGTELPYARKALEIMGCARGSNPPGRNLSRFAEIIAGTCLAGELSLIASLAEGSLARAHARHRRL
jgi:hydroxymethylglutaryl-CoA reductase (NADPH)